MKLTAGVITSNDQQTIGPLLKRLIEAPNITEIFVVSSACTDHTEEIVRQIAETDPRITLISESVRRGKSAAINTYLSRRSPSDLTLISSGDVLPDIGAVQLLCEAFADTRVGMAGGRPTPVNDPNTLTGGMAHLLWELHHQVALQNPKLGELIVFQSQLIDSISGASPVDEASIEHEILTKDRSLAYVPEALVFNRSPSSLREWFCQRRRIAYGHRWLAKHSAYHVATLNRQLIAGLLASQISTCPKLIVPAIALLSIEMLAHVAARADSLGGGKTTQYGE